MMSFLENEGFGVSKFAGAYELPNGETTEVVFARTDGLLLGRSNNASQANSEG